MADPKLARFAGEKYISLETFKKNGEGVKTPVWFAQRDEVLYCYTEADSWKVKRIRNNPRVRVAVCTMRGEVKGPWLDGTASLVDGEERRAADALLDQKYWMKRLFNLLTPIRGHARVVIRIKIA